MRGLLLIFDLIFDVVFSALISVDQWQKVILVFSVSPCLRGGFCFCLQLELCAHLRFLVEMMAMHFTGSNVVRIEAEALRDLADRIDGPMSADFLSAVECLHACGGRVVVTGMGKSGIIGRKIAATLSSTGTPALFLHPAEAVHGDLGMLVKGDVVLALSSSGETEEILALLPTIKRLGAKLISMT